MPRILPLAALLGLPASSPMELSIVPTPRASVVLVYPKLHEHQFPIWAPLDLYAIATALLHRGYTVHLIDERLGPSELEELERVLPGALFVGVGAKFGGQLGNALAMVQRIKRVRPDARVVIGGWLPSLFPETLFESPLVDGVVIGPGDESTPELADRWLAGRSVEGVAGVWARENGAIVRNPFVHLPDIRRTTPIPWETMGMTRYQLPNGWTNLFTSRGCPGECTFCSIYCLDPRRWTALPAERVVADIERLLGLGFRAIRIMDTDFCADARRVEAICRSILERRLDVRWEVLARHWNLRAMSDEQVRLLRRAGCTEIEMGVETGSQRLSDMVRKKLDVTEVPATVTRFVRHGIRMNLNFMFGLPTETRADLRATLRLIDELTRLGPDAVRLQMFRYTPVPGGSKAEDDVWKQRPGGSAELSLQELIDFPVVETEPQRLWWVTPEHERDVRRCYYFYAPLAYIPAVQEPARSRPVWSRVLRLLRPLARLRCRHAFFALPFEHALNRRFGYPFQHGSEDGVGPPSDVLEPVMGDHLERRPPLEPSMAT